MGAPLVVGKQPVMGDLPHLIQILKQVTAQHLLAVSSVEPFNKIILVRLARLDIANLDSLTLTPVDKDL